jgi:glycosyltransferase involved in cell wall biosynthesis
MKIALFSDNFYPEISGISDSIITISKELALKGHIIQIYAPRYSKRDYARAHLPYKEIDLGENVSVVRIPSIPYVFAPTGQGQMVIPFLWSYRHIQKFNPDIIHTHLFFGVGIEALICAKLLHKPFVGTNHTPLSEFMQYAPIHWKWLTRIGIKYENWYYNHCQWITAPSQGILDKMKRDGLQVKTHTISNPINLVDFKKVSDQKKQALKQKFSLTPHTVLYAGRLAKEKHIDIIIRAIQALRKDFPDICFAITGIGSEEATLKQLVSDLDLKQHVRFFGYVEKETLIEIYQASDVFAVMSTAELQCISMMQAMVVGIPVIGADAWALPEYIHPDHGYIIPKGDTAMLTQTLRHLFTHPKKMQTLGEAGHVFVQQFSAEAILKKWERLFSHNNPAPLKLSLVIPAYNEEKLLGQCLSSIIKATREVTFDTEIIVVNNASSDNTEAIAQSFPEVRIVNEPRKGLVMARRAGYIASTGNLIANIDADTIMPAHWIQTVFQEFSTHRNIVALSGPYIYYDLSPFVRFLVKCYYYLGYIDHLFNHHILHKGAMLQGGNFVLRKDALEKIGGYNLDFDFYGEDTDMATRIQKVGTVKFAFYLPMRTSGRRLQEEGVFITGVRYMINHIWTILFDKPYTKTSQDIRK